MRLEHHLVGGYVRYISPYIIIIIRNKRNENEQVNKESILYNSSETKKLVKWSKTQVIHLLNVC